jgi:hypothetical protein
MPKKLLGFLLAFIMISIIFSGCIGPGERIFDTDNTQASVGISWADMVPIKKTTFVGYDPDSYLDDYAYLSAVPASVFFAPQSNQLYSNPLLFYQPPVDISDDEKRTLNANEGIEYFMEDWLTYSEGNLDGIQFINMNSADMDAVKSMANASSIEIISGKSPAEVSKNIALTNWEFSDGAVVAVVEADYDMKAIETANSVSGKTPSANVEKGEFTGEAEPDPVNPIFHDFTIGEDYKYVTAYMTWGSDYNPIADITERGKDPDLQLYDEQLGEVAASEEWNVLSGASEFIGSYVYNAGPWKAAVTYMPTETLGIPLEEEEPQDATVTINKESGVVVDDPEVDAPIPNPFSSTVVYTIEYTLFPGIDLKLKDEAPYGCRNAVFNLDWEDGSQQLGLIVRTSSGAEISTAITQGPEPAQSIEIPELGEGEYSVAVINLGDNAQPTEFTVSYSWDQVMPKKQADGFASAAEGAIFASTKNLPLLFTSPKSLDEATKSALDTLGITKVYLVDLNRHANSNVVDSLRNYRSLLQEKIDVEHITAYSKIYNMIRENTNYNGTYQNDIVFTTLNPWSYWYTFEGLKGEHAKGLYIGPATFAAAHHGCPVFITETDERLSNSQSWHNEFWKNAWNGRGAPSVGCMVLTARQVYNFLNDYGFDYKNTQESILTVAGQFDIGTTWDRMLVGAAASGRIMGSPTDTAYWIARSVFYQSIIFANPAVNPDLDEHGGKRITGSHSLRVGGALRVVQDETEIEVEYPVAQSWVSYQHRFNERGGKYWGAEYVTVTGITPFYTPSGHELEAPLGGNWPDMTSSEIIPFYLEIAGYDSVFTTNFDTSMENINRGAIMWLEVMHGGNRDSGIVGFWNENQLEPNPWRGYEENAMTLRGSTADPDVVSMNKHVGLDIQPGTGPLVPGGLRRETHDGVIIAIVQQEQTILKSGIDFDDAMENLHSMGFSAGSCLIANTYLQLSMVRHGSVFQVIDPWLTSWYSAFAMETFCRDLILGYSVGEAYERGIKHVGIQYLTESWWWDIYENVVYYGDPDLRVFTPMHKWERPTILKIGKVIEGHAPFGAASHPYAIADTSMQEAGLYTSAVLVPVAIGFVYIRRHRKKKGLHKAKLSQS